MTPLYIFTIQELKEMLGAVERLDVSKDLDRQERKERTLKKICFELFQRDKSGESFNQGYEVMKYLLENPCQEPNCEGHPNCNECIHYAIHQAEYDAETKRRAKDMPSQKNSDDWRKF